MAKYNPIRTTDPDLTRVQDRIRDTANATTARLDSLQGQIDSASRMSVQTVGTSTDASPDVDLTLVNTTSGMALQLPDAAKVSRPYLRYKNLSSSNSLTLLAQAVNGRQQTINGTLAFFVVAASSTATLVSDGSNYHSI